MRDFDFSPAAKPPLEKKGGQFSTFPHKSWQKLGPTAIHPQRPRRQDFEGINAPDICPRITGSCALKLLRVPKNARNVQNFAIFVEKYPFEVFGPNTEFVLLRRSETQGEATLNYPRPRKKKRDLGLS